MNDTKQIKNIARRNLDTAEQALSDALRWLPVRHQIDKSSAWLDVYYSPTATRIAAFRAAHPDRAELCEIPFSEFLAASAAYETARLADKAAKSARKEAKESRAAEKSLDPARPLKSENPVAYENYGLLLNLFADRRIQYIKDVLEVVIRRTGGKVCANTNEVQVQQAAAASFDGFIAKLAGKITSLILSADLSSGIWDYSYLTVQTAEGAQIWKTKVILNVSVLGKVFNQWPTRRVS